MAAELGAEFVPGARYGLTSQLDALTHNGKGVNGEGADPKEAVRYYDGLQPHVHLVSGVGSVAGAPAGYYAMTVSEALADRIGLKPGDTYGLRLPTYHIGGFRAPQPPLVPACFSLTGIWTPINASDSFWGGEPPTGFVLERGAYFTFLPTLIPNVPPNYPTGQPSSIEASSAYGGQYWAPDLARLHIATVPHVTSTLTWGQ